MARRLTHVLTGLALALAAAVAPIPADAVDAEYVSGMFTSGGQPLAGVRVGLWRLEGPGPHDFFPRGSSGVTDTSGRYRIDVSGLVPDSYALSFLPGGGTHWPEFYDNAPIPAEGTLVPIGDGVSNPGLDADLEVASRITGRMLDKYGNALGGGVTVTAHPTDSADMNGYHVSNIATSNHLGDYSIGPLPAGTYQLEFSDTAFAFATEYWEDQPTIDTAKPVVVGTGETASGYDAIISLGGHLEGTVRDTAGNPVRGLGVLAYLWDTSADDWVSLDSFSTDYNGNYRSYPLRPGEYRVCFTSDADTQPAVVDECWDDEPTLEDATTITVTEARRTSGVDAVMTRVPSPDTPDPIPTPTSTPPSPAVPPAPTTAPALPPLPPPGPPAPAPAVAVATFVDGVTVTGKPRVGKTLRLANVRATGIGVKVQWYAGKKPIRAATRKRLTVDRSLQGKAITVMITAKIKAGGFTATRIIKVGKVR